MSKVRVLEHAVLHAFHSFLRLDLFRVSYPLFAGGMSDPKDRVNVHRKDAVAGILHIVGEEGRQCLMLVEQFRLPTMIGAADGMPSLDEVNSGGEKTGRIIELMAGTQIVGEPWLETFRRECLEETNLEPDEVEFITSYYPSPGACSEQIHLYYGRIKWPVGRDWPETGADEWMSLGDEEEDIRGVFVTPAEFLDDVASGNNRDGKCLVAAEWMRRNLHRFGLGAAP
ncbi:MAG: NUDIX hydrolase [Henriciella sp.]